MVNKKILISILFLISVIFIGVVYADETGIQEIVKSKIDIPESYTVFNSAVADGNTSKFWWRTPVDAENGGEISVTADENGNILNYYHFKNNYISKDEGAHFSVYNKSDSRFFALRFIERVCPELADKVEYNSSSLESDISKNMKTASVSFYRVENGVPYYDNYMNFVIDLNTSEVVQYTLNWDFDAEFPDVSQAITQQQAMREYTSRIGIKLQYRLKKEDGKNKAYIVYAPQKEGRVLDANTGKVVDEEILVDSNSYFDGYSDNVESDIITLTEQEISNLPSVQLNISSAEEYVRGISETGLTDEYTLTYSSYEKINGNYCANLEFSRLPSVPFEEMTEQEKLMYLAGDYSYVRLKIDIQSKDIMYMHCYNKEVEPLERRMSETEVEGHVVRFLKRYLPLKFDNSEFSEIKGYSYNTIYKFVLSCYVGDIPFNKNNIVIEYDWLTGKFISLECNWLYDVEFESATDLISWESARDQLFSKVPLQLTYINTMEGIKAVYDFYPFYPAAVGAKDGKLKNTDGSDYKIRKYDNYFDIEGHYAQGMIMRLNNNLIISSDNENYFRPDENVSQKDFLTWMTAALTGTNYENTDELYNYLTVNGVILTDEVHPEAEILKEDAIVFFIRALGYESIAKAEDIYKLDFADSNTITPDKIGYIALAKGIGMVTGDENNRIEAKVPLKRGDACCMIYKYLSR